MPFKVRSTDAVQHHIDPGIRQPFREVGLAVVDAAGCSQLFTEPALFIRACRGVYGCTELNGQLNCRCSDTAPSPMDQQSFARLQLSTLKDIVPHRKYGFGQARSVNKIDM